MTNKIIDASLYASPSAVFLHDLQQLCSGSTLVVSDHEGHRLHLELAGDCRAPTLH